MGIQKDILNRAASLLWDAEKNKQACAPVSTLLGEHATIHDAYAIQQINIEKKIAEGARIVGKKIGLTSTVVQQQLGVDQPDFGSILHDMIHTDGASIALSSLLQPKVEAEVAFVLKKDLNRQHNTFLDIIHAIDYVLPAIEVVDSRIRDWKITIHDTIADNASSALVILGQKPVYLNEIEINQLGMSLYVNNELATTGHSASCLGSPLISTVWLANTLAQQGSPLRAGDLVLSGALGAMTSIDTPAHVRAEIQSLGSVRVNFV
ncbi:2-keto-4-pentenoate hydratase [Acinetobacter sp. WZC-1]|uniref:2-keto-4-pentenoate hydratase n=1 Tax=Acinetobacter sp. WZC-1 TaxID=3459034 RepID=UPI00403DF2ED